MYTSLATRISGLLQQILAQSGWLRSELRELGQAGHGHRRMRELCDLLDSLDSSIHWDLRDELQDLAGPSSPQATRILDWLAADIEPLERQLDRLDEQCPGHPLVAVARSAGAEIIARYRDIAEVLGQPACRPFIARARGALRPTTPAAEIALLC